MAKAKKSSTGQNLSYYKTKAKTYLAQLNSVSVMHIHDIRGRHGSIDAMIQLLTKIQGLIKPIAERSERDKEGWFPELRTYQKHVDYLKRYTETYTLEYLMAQQIELPEQEQGDVEELKMRESNKQLDIIQTVSKFDRFIESLIEIPEVKTSASSDIKDHYSLNDLRLI